MSEPFDPVAINFDEHQENPARDYGTMVKQLVDVHQGLAETSRAASDVSGNSISDVDKMSQALGRVYARFEEIIGHELTNLVNDREGFASPPRTLEQNIAILEEDSNIFDKLSIIRELAGVENDSQSPLMALIDSMRETIDSTKTQLGNARDAKLDAPASHDDILFGKNEPEADEPARDVIRLPTAHLDL